MLRTASILATVAMLLGILAHSTTIVRPRDTRPYHARVADAISLIPRRFGSWEGSDTPLPQSAQSLLRPNAAISRQYRDLRSGLAASLIVVQSRDPRDVAGHYPPNCYPRAGWTEASRPAVRNFDLGGINAPVMIYEFVRDEYTSSPRMSVYSFFILPFRGLRPDMTGVRRATGDFRRRPYGAAQVQVVMESTLPPETRDAIFRRFMEELMPLVKVISQPEPTARELR